MQDNPTPPPTAQTSPNVEPSEEGELQFLAPWDQYFKAASAKAQNPTYVLTYFSLGQDMGGAPSNERRQAIGKLLSQLQLPKGGFVFWPCAEFDGNELQPNAAMFWRGWSAWSSPYVICLGERALEVIAPDQAHGATTIFLEQTTIFTLPQLSAWAGLLPHEQLIALEPITQTVR